MGEARKDALRVGFDRTIKLQFHGSRLSLDSPKRDFGVDSWAPTLEIRPNGLGIAGGGVTRVPRSPAV